jgi:DnaJ domain
MLWLVLAALGALLFFARRGSVRLPVPNARNATILGVSLFALLALRGGRLPVALGLGLFALGLATFWRLDAERLRRAEEPQAPPPRGGRMSLQEAYALLGLAPGASAEEIKRAHRRLMKDAHPDAGGSHARAARLNAAKERLLGRG